MIVCGECWCEIDRTGSCDCEKVDPYATSNVVDHPKHYTKHPSGVECIQVTEHMSFNLGNAIKYIWRADEKGKPLEDLEKAIWYIKREIQRRNKKNDS